MGFDATGAQWELVSTTHQRSARTTRFLDDIIRHIYLNTKGSLPLHRMLRDLDLPGPLKSDFIQAADEEWLSWKLQGLHGDEPCQGGQAHFL